VVIAAERGGVNRDANSATAVHEGTPAGSPRSLLNLPRYGLPFTRTTLVDVLLAATASDVALATDAVFDTAPWLPLITT
jgi:hypothetical protein